MVHKCHFDMMITDILGLDQQQINQLSIFEYTQKKAYSMMAFVGKYGLHEKSKAAQKEGQGNPIYFNNSDIDPNFVSKVD